jgi:hypothetical protein
MPGKKSIGADKTPPRKLPSTRQMVDIRGNALSTEQGVPLVSERESYSLSDYGADFSPSVVLNSSDYRRNGISSQNTFSSGKPAALPIIERFSEQSEVSRSLLGITRETTQQGLFSNVSSYGLDPKDWRVDASDNDSNPSWWNLRPSAAGNYFFTSLIEDDKNSSIVLSTSPTPFLVPPRPSIQDQLISAPDPSSYNTWGQYINSIIALYLFKYMVRNFTPEQRTDYNLDYLLTRYPPIDNGDGTLEFNEILWDQIWLDIQQNRFGAVSNYPLVPFGTAYNFSNSLLSDWRNTSLWGSAGVLITEADTDLPPVLDVSWYNFFFSTTRVFFPVASGENRGHFKIRTNPDPRAWEKYFGLRYNNLRSDLKAWEFTVHENESTVTSLERDLKLPYIVLDPALPGTVFSTLWPPAQYNLPTITNRIGGSQGTQSEITLKSLRAFRYQPGRISGFTYGVKMSEIGSGPGTTIEFGIENDTDAYMFRLTNGANFSIIRKSTVPLEDTTFLQDARYSENTRTIVRAGQLQYETTIGQNIMNGDPLGGEGESGYILDPDTVTMYKIEFGWYGAIGARFYAYVPVGNNDCRWVILHTLVIENQLGRPCLADPFFYFKYRLKVDDSSAIRVDQTLHKFGASYYIDGYDEGTLYNLNAQSGQRALPSPGFSESKTRLSSIDWITLMGIRPKQFLTNRFGTSIFNKKEIFPERMYVYSQQDCEIKIISQRGCPEFAYNHQEGYQWTSLPESRRLKAKFSISPYFDLDQSGLGIVSADPSTHTAIAAYSTSSLGDFRDPRVLGNWSVVGDQAIRILGDDLFALYTTLQDFSGSSVILNLKRSGGYLSSRNPLPPTENSNIYLPFTYSTVSPYETGYDIEFDYFRRDQILLSTVDVYSGEFYIYWVGLELGGIIPAHVSGMRFGFAWPDTANPSSDIYATGSDINWGIEPNIAYDGGNFYEGLPYDFAGEYRDNSVYVETPVSSEVDTFNIESSESSYFDLSLNRILSVPGTEGGLCSGLLGKVSRQVVRNVSVIVEGSNYFVLATELPWPNLSPDSFSVTLSQGAVSISVTTTGGIERVVDETTIYLLPIGNTLPAGIAIGAVTVSYNNVFLATIDKKSQVRSILVSRIAPADIPFIRVFVQGRQGSSIGGIWIGQKTAVGINIDPLTPHRSTTSISDIGTDYHSEWSSSPQTNGAVKSIRPRTQLDPLGVSTAPTFDSSEATLDTYKSIHTNPRKCGSFVTSSGTNSAGIMIGGEYPLRWFSNPGQQSPLGTFYVSANQPTEIELGTIFNVTSESIVNDDDNNLATFFIARALNNHPETASDIYLSLNYTEQ